MKNILFISDSNTKFKTLIDLAVYFNATKKYKSIFYFDDFSDKLMNEPEVCKAKNIEYFFSYRTQGDSLKQNIKINPLEKSGFKKYYSYALFKLKPYFKTYYSVKNYKNQIGLAEQFIQNKNINAIVSCEDNYGISTIFIKASKNLGKRSFVIPFSIANKEELGFTFSSIKETHIKGLKKKVFFTLFNNWKTNYNGIGLSYLQPFDILAQTVTGIAPHNPYISVGGRSDVKLFESKFMLDYYSGSGFKKTENTYVLGSLKFDVLYQLSKNKNDKKKELFKELNLTENKPVILCSLPPDYYPNHLYKDHKDIIENWMCILTSFKSHYVFVNLHPRTIPESVSYLKSFPVHVINRSIEELIPLCDIFVASLSATIRYALACHKPVLNFDFVKVQYSEYNNLEQVKTVYTKEDFKASLEKLCANLPEDKFSDDYFGKVDGKCGERIEKIFDLI